MAEFRGGNDAAAEAAFLQAEELAETDHWHPELRLFIQGPARLYRAMILFRNRKTLEAEKLFRMAEGPMPPIPEDGRQVLPGNVTQDHLLYWLAYEEAGQLLGLPLRKRSRPAVAVLLPPNSQWKWFHPLDGADPAIVVPIFHTAFAAADFDDRGWQTGQDQNGPKGGFGYDDADFDGLDIGRPATKEVGYSAYFRTRFTTDQPQTHLELHCRRDDGIIVYLDGREVARDNMSDGPEGYRLPAAGIVLGTEESAVQRIPLPGVTLPAGEHVLAISLHNPVTPSSDLRIGGITLVQVEADPVPKK